MVCDNGHVGPAQGVVAAGTEDPNIISTVKVRRVNAAEIVTFSQVTPPLLPAPRTPTLLPALHVIDDDVTLTAALVMVTATSATMPTLSRPASVRRESETVTETSRIADQRYAEIDRIGGRLRLVPPTRRAWPSQ